MDVFRELEDRVERECGSPRPSVAGNRGKVWASCQRARWRTTPGLFSTPTARLPHPRPRCLQFPHVKQLRRLQFTSPHLANATRKSPPVTWPAFFHVLTDGANHPALDCSNQPKSRDELDKSNLGLWQTVIARMLNTATYLSQPVVLRKPAVVCMSLHL